jgi:hypothetical protein
MGPKSLTDIFGRFAGAVINVDESIVTKDGKPVCFLDPADPVVGDLRAAAKANGFPRLRVIVPGGEILQGRDEQRINATVEKGPDSKWRIGRDFTIG